VTDSNTASSPHVTLSGNTSTTWSNDPNKWLLSIVHDDEGWIVSEARTTVYGYGQSLLHALCDFHAALESHLEVLPSDVPQSARLQRISAEIMRLLGRTPT
jgi:hypothetical protein